MNQQLQPPQSTPLFNPWSPEFIADPYPYYHRLRATEPIHLTPLGFHVVSRHADVAAILCKFLALLMISNFALA